MSEQDDPGEVAAAYAQQQLIAAIRDRAGARVSAADVAEALGRDRTDRTVPDVWSGRRAISMRMWFTIALAYGINPFAYGDPTDPRTLLPPAHQTWLGPWRPGDGLPRFRAPFGPDGEPVWSAVTKHLSTWLDREDDTGRLRLADSRVATHAAIEGLADAGLPVELVSAPPSSHDLTYETNPPTDVAVRLISDLPSISQDTLLTVVDDLRQLAHTSTGRPIALLILAPRSMRRLDVLIPGLARATQGDSIPVPPTTTRRQPADPRSDTLPPDLALTMTARSFAINGYITLLCNLHKNGTAP